MSCKYSKCIFLNEKFSKGRLSDYQDDETEGVVFRSGHVMQAQKTAEQGVVLA